jgi:predicted RNA methylase
MAYRLAEKGDFGDLASGSVLRSAPGHPAFPVRLASEIFQRAALRLPGRDRLTLWDPCCGSGYLATVLGLLHRDRLGMVLASDADEGAVALAKDNLALLTETGLRARAVTLEDRARRFAKPSYDEAASAARRLAGSLAAGGGDLPAAARRADVFDPGRLVAALDGLAPDLVITDVPYGHQTRWAGAAPAGGELEAMVRTLASVLPRHALIAVVAEARRIPLPGAVERLRVGKRACAIIPVP